MVHINVPNAYSFHRLLALEMGLVTNVHEKSELNKLLQQRTVFDLNRCSYVATCGFKILDQGACLAKPFTAQQMQDMIDQNIIQEEVIEDHYKMRKYLPEMGFEI